MTQVKLPEKGEKVMGPEWRKEGTDDLSKLSIVVTQIEVEKRPREPHP